MYTKASVARICMNAEALYVCLANGEDFDHAYHV